MARPLDIPELTSFDPQTGEPSEDAVLALVNDMRRNGVLMSTTGYPPTALKIRPPLLFSMDDSDKVVKVFAQRVKR